MKLSSDTLDVLKNFSKINTEIKFQEGNVQFSISSGKNLFAYARFVESFPLTFGIYDLNAFLGVLSLYDDDVDLEFEPQQVVLRGRGGRSKTTYRYTALNLLKVPVPTKEQFEQVLGGLPWVAHFDMSAADFKWVRDTTQTLQSPHFSIESDGNQIQIKTFDLEDDSQPVQSLVVGTGPGVPFRAVYLSQNLRFLVDDFKVSWNNTKGTVRFATQTRGVDYYIAAQEGHTKYGN